MTVYENAIEVFLDNNTEAYAIIFDELPAVGGHIVVDIEGEDNDYIRLTFKGAIAARNLLNEWYDRQMRALHAKEGQAV